MTDPRWHVRRMRSSAVLTPSSEVRETHIRTRLPRWLISRSPALRHAAPRVQEHCFIPLAVASAPG